MENSTNQMIHTVPDHALKVVSCEHGNPPANPVLWIVYNWGRDRVTGRSNHVTGRLEVVTATSLTQDV